MPISSQIRRILLVYPEFFPTYWGMQYFLPLVGQKAIMPPLGLITIAAMTPGDHEFRLVDLNCGPLTDEDIAWADVVLMSAMLPQKTSLFRAADRCRAAGKFVVFGGPYPTACADECEPHCDSMVLNEGEITWPMFLTDLKAGGVRKRYESEEKPDVTRTPCPRFDLLRVSDYAVIPVQFSRGCPFQCEFCDIIVMYGRKPRTKTPAQLLAELDALHKTGFRGRVFIVDDNFIGNKKEVARLLPELNAWNKANGNPFFYGTEASVNLSEDENLMKEMVDANFLWVFLGIETPSAEGLRETKKFQNVAGTSLPDKIKSIQKAGMMVYGGFIIGFDSDREDIFERQIEFITQAAIPNAMIGPLVALPGTPLHRRMIAEGRLLTDKQDEERTVASGYTNILTKISRRALLEGHKKIVQTIYNPREYFARSAEAFRRLPRPEGIRARLKKFRQLMKDLSANTVKKDGVKKPPLSLKIRSLMDLFRMLPRDYRRESLRFVWSVLRSCPEQLPRLVGFILMGYHYYMFTFKNVVPDLEGIIAKLPADAPLQKAAS